jgi:AcrR family transcriptional regulator
VTAHARLGRPPAAESAHTLDTLLAVARAQFGALGYQAATTKGIAAEAGITTGTIYHYFGAKRDLYAAVFDEVEDTVYARYRAVLREGAPFAENLDQLLAEAVRIHDDDPTLARFFIEVQTEAMRNDELASLATTQARNTVKLIAPLVQRAHDAGELAPGVSVRATTYAVMAVLTGVARFSETLAQSVMLTDAVDVLRRLVTGSLYAR